MERFRDAHQLKLPLDGLAVLVFHQQQGGPGQRRAEIAQPAVDHIAEQEQQKDKEIIPLVLGGGTLFRRQEQRRNGCQTERDLFQQAERLPGQHKKNPLSMDTAAEASRKKYQVLRVKFSFIKSLLPAKRRRLPLKFRFFKYYITISGGLCYNKENLT